MREDISRDFRAIGQVERGALQRPESIYTCEWFTDRLERMQKNLDAFNAALDALTHGEDVRALRAYDAQNLVLVHLISLSSDAEVNRELRELVHEINHRPSGESVANICERRFSGSLLGNIQRWFVRNQQAYQDHLQYQTRRDFVAGLVAVGFLGRERVAAALHATVRAFQAFRWAGTGRDPRNEIAQVNRVAPDLRDNV